MPSWDPEQYLRFAEERSRPCHELVQRITLEAPPRVIDLGCGPGNSTAILAARFPEAALSGLDSSPAMIEAARKSAFPAHWSVGDIASWAAHQGEPLGLVFSNAAFQWVLSHETLIPALMARVDKGGALAFQVPANKEAAAHEAARRLAASARWRAAFPKPVREWDVRPAEVYYDLLAPLSARLDLWFTDYIQVMPDAAAIVDWYKGSGLRPYLDPLSEADRAAFLTGYEALIADAYPERPDGKVLFPFRRMFCVAYQD